MPLKLNVSVSKKIGQPDFGSLGASCAVEVELPHNIVFDDLEAFHRHARNVYVAATQAVNDELARHQQAPNAASSNGHTATTNGNGHHANGNGHNGNGNGHAAPRRSNARKATASQARALHAIADRQGFDLAAELQTRFGVNEPEELSITEASQTIDDLKASANGSSNGRR